MNQTTVFRFMVVASIVTAILGGFVDAIVPSLLPAALGDAYEAYAATDDPTLSHALALGGVALVMIIAGVASTIGLLLFKPWSRQLSLWFSVVATLGYPFFGPTVYSGWAAMLTETSMMLWGAALAMAYFAEIKVRFEKELANDATRSPVSADLGMTSHCLTMASCFQTATNSCRQPVDRPRY